MESDGRVVSMTQVQTDRVICSEVEAILARGEYLDRMMDLWVRAAVLQHAPVIASYLPNYEDSLSQRYVPLVNMETTLELTKMFNLIPGMLGIASDAVMSATSERLYTLCPKVTSPCFRPGKT